jgi:hypothetical protein
MEGAKKVIVTRHVLHCIGEWGIRGSASSPRWLEGAPALQLAEMQLFGF